MNDLLAPLDGLLPEMESLYTDLHAHPELSMQENRTAGIAAERLRAAGYEVTTGRAEERGTGTQAMIDDGVFSRFPRPDVALGQHVVASFGRYLPAGRVPEAEPTSAGEDFGCFGAAWHVPSVFWSMGGTDPVAYAAARAAGRMGDLPTNHNPRFAPVLHPTLRTGVEAAVAAARAWLSP